jgi:hypothetical protein
MSDNIPKIEEEISVMETYNKIIMSRCNSFGCISLISAVGVGFLAYSATHIYVGFCAPAGLMGFVQSLVIMDSTFCQLLMGIITHSQSLYGAMVVGLLFSFMSGINKLISGFTGIPEGEIPQTVQIKKLTKPQVANAT